MAHFYDFYRSIFLLLIFLVCANCVSKTYFYPYGPDKGDLIMIPADEGSSVGIEFQNPFVYFQVHQRKAFVNINGFVVFDQPINFFQNQELTEFQHSFVAAFYADIDTTNPDDSPIGSDHGQIYYRLANDSTVLKRATQLVRQKFLDAQMFEATTCLLATWDKVGYFNAKHDKTNSFQIVLIQGADQSYVQLLYADGGIQWITSEGKDPNLPDAPAQAGFISNDGRSFTLLSSGRDEMVDIHKQTNIEMPGVFLYRVSGETIVGPEQVMTGNPLSRGSAAIDPEFTDYAENADDEDDSYFDDSVDDVHDEDEALVLNNPDPPVGPAGQQPTPLAPAPDADVPTTPLAAIQPTPEPEPVAPEPEPPVPEPEVPAAEPVTSTEAPAPEPEPASVTVAAEPDIEYEDHTDEPHMAPPLPPCPDDPYHGVCPPDCRRENVPPGCQKCVCPDEEGQTPQEPPTLPPPPPPTAPEIPVDSNRDPYSGGPLPSGQSCAEAAGQTNCHAQATCVDQQVGFCCQCKYGHFGNGLECLADAEPQRINGRFSGRINGVEIPETDLHTYVVTSDGRAYTALSQISPSMGRPLLLLSTIGGVMGWLFAKPSSDQAYNGFMLTGGLFNRTVIVHFGDKHTVTIQQDFSGKDIFHYFKAKVFVTGSLPALPDDATVEFGEYTEEYNRVGSGIVKSYSSKRITVASQSSGPQDFQMTIDQTIRYSECAFKKFDKDALTVLRIERSYVVYDPAEQIVRYASGNSVETLGESREDPCRDGHHDCTGQHMTCARDGNKFRCLCLDGYELIFTNDLNTKGVCVDLNECNRNLHRCDSNAQCHNIEGGYTCICNPGYRGSGYKCISDNHCGPFVCDDHAECLPVMGTDNTTECVCKAGYYGDGIRCSSFDAPPDEPPTSTSGDQTCAELSCHREADCVTKPEGGLLCVCKPGYTGDGFSCAEEARHPIGPVCSSHDECHRYGACIFNTALNHYQCQCRPPYSGDGRHCFLEAETCDRAHNCDQNADCVYQHTELGPGYLCRCRSGFTGDGHSCQPIRTSLAPPSCKILNNCSPNAQCLQIGSTWVCRCNSGYKGDGYKCEQDVTIQTERRCRSQDDCHPSGHCVNREGRDRDEYICECLPGFKGNGVTTCEPADQCNPGAGTNSCGHNSVCSYDDVEQAYVCKCEQGFEGDGRNCRRSSGQQETPRPQPTQSCQENRNLCHSRAECVPDYEARVYKCQCSPGYRGDGYSYCEPERVTCDTQNICDYNARCHQGVDGRPNCVCNPGFEGDGLYCRPAPDCSSKPEICDGNAVCLPENQKYVCRCKPGYQGNGQKCRSDQDSMDKTLVFAQGMSLVQRGVQPDDRGRQLIVVPHQIAVGVDFDCKEDKIFWTDVSGHAIRSAKADGSNVTLLFENDLDSPEGIAVDWASRNFYYTDSQKDIIGVSTMDGKYSYPLVKEGLVNPRALAVDLQNRKLYWSDWHRERPMIGRINLDGSNREVFVQDDIGLPNGLVILHRHRELCWADAGKNRLECMSIHGGRRRVVYAPLGYPFGLAIQNEETFFWTDWEDKKVHSVSVYGGNHASFTPGIGGSGKLYGIIALSNDCPPGDSPCGTNNGGCKFICLPDSRGGRVCACPENVVDSECNVLNNNI